MKHANPTCLYTVHQNPLGIPTMFSSQEMLHSGMGLHLAWLLDKRKQLHIWGKEWKGEHIHINILFYILRHHHSSEECIFQYNSFRLFVCWLTWLVTEQHTYEWSFMKVFMKGVDPWGDQRHTHTHFEQKHLSTPLFATICYTPTFPLILRTPRLSLLHIIFEPFGYHSYIFFCPFTFFWLPLWDAREATDGKSWKYFFDFFVLVFISCIVFYFHFHFSLFCKFVVNFGFHFFNFGFQFHFFHVLFIFFRFGFHFSILVFIFFHFSLASVIFGGLKPSLANLIWTKPEKTKKNEKKNEKKWKNEKTSSFFHFWRFETFTGKPHLDEASKNRGKWKKTKKTKKMKKWKNLEFFSFLEVWNLHWQTSFGPNQQKPRQMKTKRKKQKKWKNLEFFSFLEVWNLHWQTSFGRNQQKPRQMKKKTKNEKMKTIMKTKTWKWKKMKKNENNNENKNEKLFSLASVCSSKLLLRLPLLHLFSPHYTPILCSPRGSMDGKNAFFSSVIPHHTSLLENLYY